MWLNGLKSEACRQMLFSNFKYSDFVELLQSLPPEQSSEMGTMLDQMAPEADKSASTDRGLESFLNQSGRMDTDAQADLEAEGKLT